MMEGESETRACTGARERERGGLENKGKYRGEVKDDWSETQLREVARKAAEDEE